MSDRCRLYLISPPKLSAANFLGPLKEALGGGDVACFQLRLKNIGDDEIRRAVDILRPAVQAAGTAFILNDRPDLAAELGCDGAHVGQEDSSYAEARRLQEFLKNFVVIPADLIPPTSILREFIGKSGFRY